MIINQFLIAVEQHSVFIKEIKEHCRRNPLVSVGEAVILSNEVQQIGRLFFQGRIYFLPSKGLIDVSDTA